MINRLFLYPTLFLLLMFLQSCDENIEQVSIKENARIALIGNNLCSRMMNYGHFETEMYANFPDKNLVIRNMCDGGNTPGFRPHSGRESPWAFPGAENFYQNELANNSKSVGIFPTEDEWLESIKPDIILAFFGYNESFEGDEGLESFKNELSAFIDHTLMQKYNGSLAPELILVSPIFFEDLSDRFDYPDGKLINERLASYTNAMADISHLKNIRFLDVLSETKKWEDYTVDGFQLSESAYEKLGKYMADELFDADAKRNSNKELIHEYVLEKNWMWHNDFKIPNGVHVFGRRHEPFGIDNYPAELIKIREMTSIRDSAIWSAAHGTTTDLSKKDERTQKLKEIETNYKPKNIADQEYKYGDDFLETFTLPEGYKIDLFATEKEFPDLANPCQMSFDDKGRLWVAVMPSYPHYQPGDARPNDKLLILEDTDGDGKADRQIIFADGLHLPTGFEIAPEGVYISQGTNLKLYTDTDGDDRADESRIIMSGFDDHDTHHVISAFTADPSGALYMGEGVFLHSNVETAYGPARATNGGFYRYNPSQNKLERTGNMPIPNPWGTAFDKWGQNFFLHTSGPTVNWMMPSTVKPRYGVSVPNTNNLIEEKQRVRPTSGIEFVSSRHFPDEVQGDMLLNNTIGFLGTKQHKMKDDGTGYSTSFRQDLVKSTDGNYRPVDLEFAPDGSLYILDWHNILVGHMQHNARDPLRDHVHGRVLRITYPDRPLVKPAKIADASIEELFENLNLPEFRSRYRSKRVLRGKDQNKVYNYLQTWKENQADESSLLEGLWVSWGINKLDTDLLNQLINSSDYRVRTAAVRVLRYNWEKVDNAKEILMKTAADEEGRVRLETLVAATWMPAIDGNDILDEVEKYPIDDWMKNALKYGRAHMNDHNVDDIKKETVESKLKGKELESFVRGKEIYQRDGYCATCHQEDGKGLAQSGFPPLKDSEWVLASEEVLIRLTLKGIYGPITVAGKKYPGQVPMPPYEKMLNDQEIADVLTYVRNAFGNESPIITTDMVIDGREAVKDKEGYYSADEFLRTFQIQ